MQALVVGDSRVMRLQDVWRPLPGWDLHYISTPGMKWSSVEEHFDKWVAADKKKPSAVIIFSLYVDAMKRETSTTGKRIGLAPAITDAKNYAFPNINGLRPLLKRVTIKLKEYWRGTAVFWVVPFTPDVRRYHEYQLRLRTGDKEENLNPEEELRATQLTVDFYQYFELVAKFTAEEVGSYFALPWHYFCNHTLKPSEDRIDTFMEKLKEGTEDRRYVYPLGHDDGIHPSRQVAEALRRSIKEKLHKLYSPNPEVSLSFLSAPASAPLVLESKKISIPKNNNNVNNGARPKVIESQRRNEVVANRLSKSVIEAKKTSTVATVTAIKSKTSTSQMNNVNRTIDTSKEKLVLQASALATFDHDQRQEKSEISSITVKRLSYQEEIKAFQGETRSPNVDVSLEALSLKPSNELQSVVDTGITKAASKIPENDVTIQVDSSVKIVQYPCGHASNTDYWMDLTCRMCGGSRIPKTGSGLKVVIEFHK